MIGKSPGGDITRMPAASYLNNRRQPGGKIIFLTQKDFFTKNRQGFNVKENLVLLGFLIIIFIPMFFINFLGMYFTLGLFLFYLNFVLKIPLVKNTIITLSTIIVVHLVFVKIFKLSFPEIWFVE